MNMNQKIFSGEEDEKISNGLVNEIIPLLKGKTINQIEKALDKIIETIKFQVVIK